MERINHPTNTERTVLVAVDVQNDFIDGTLPVPEGADVVAPVNEIADTVRAHDGTVVFTRDWHPAETPHFDAWPVHCVAETDGAAFHPDLDVRDNDIIISKGTEQTDGYSGWEGEAEDGQTLETIIMPKDPRERVRVLLGGLATDYCVKATGLDIARHFKDDDRVRVQYIADAARGVNRQYGDDMNAIAAMEAAGIELTTSTDIKREYEA